MNHNISHARVNTLFFSYNIDSREKRAMYQIYNGLSASLKSLFFYHREEEEQQMQLLLSFCCK
jgi:hypothetical protein